MAICKAYSIECARYATARTYACTICLHLRRHHILHLKFSFVLSLDRSCFRNGILATARVCGFFSPWKAERPDIWDTY